MGFFKKKTEDAPSIYKLTHPSPQLINAPPPKMNKSSSTPNLSAAKSKKLRKSKSWKFLGIWKKKSTILAPLPSNHFDEMFIPVDQKKFLVAMFDNQTKNSSLLPLKSPPQEGDSTSSDTSLINHYNYHESRPRKKPPSLTSNILQDLSSIDIQVPPEPDYTESVPLIPARSETRTASFISQPEPQFSPIRARKLSIPNNQVQYARLPSPLLAEIDEKKPSDFEEFKGMDAKASNSYKLYQRRRPSPALLRSNSDLVSDSKLISLDENDNLSHSTSKRNSTLQTEEQVTLPFAEGKSYLEFETFKDVNYQVIKNYSSSLNVKIVSPHKQSNVTREQPALTHTPDELDAKVEEFSKPLQLPPVDLTKVDQGDSDYYSLRPTVLSNDDVYRNEMLSLIETHSLMVNKKQEEINHLKNLLLQERKINTILSSPQQKSPSPVMTQSQFSSPRNIHSPKFNNSSSPGNEEGKKIRKLFIPINITVTEEAKPQNYLVFNKNTIQLLPPFDIHDSKKEPTKDSNDFNLKPFHNFKVVSPKARDILTNDLTEAEPDHSNSVSSDNSSIYYTADEMSAIDESVVEFEDDHSFYNITHVSKPTLERREISGSTTLSSVMSKNPGNIDSLNNTSISSAVTTPDSVEFHLEKSYI